VKRAIDGSDRHFSEFRDSRYSVLTALHHLLGDRQFRVGQVL
jgi:hypothetical protein